MSNFRVIQGCPCNPTLAPYIALMADEIKSPVNSIYRGADAEWILKRHGHQSQRELYNGWIRKLPGYLPANPPGRSTHELRSDGAAYAGPVGRKLAWWQQGFDVNDNEVERWKSIARTHGWILFQPYRSGLEFHHLNFYKRPRPASLRSRLKIIHLRATLPRN